MCLISPDPLAWIRPGPRPDCYECDITVTLLEVMSHSCCRHGMALKGADAVRQTAATMHVLPGARRAAGTTVERAMCGPAPSQTTGAQWLRPGPGLT
jgi:hypothetical protein